MPTLPIYEAIHERLNTIVQNRTLQEDKGAGWVLGFDPGSKNLAACLYQPSTGEHHTAKFTLPPFGETTLELAYLSAAVSHWCFDLIKVHVGQNEAGQDLYDANCFLVIREGPAFGAKFGVKDAGRQEQMIEEFALQNQLPCITVRPQSMRAFIGSKEKSDTKLNVYERYGHKFDSEDECDVYAITRCGYAIHTGEYKVKSTKTESKRTPTTKQSKLSHTSETSA